MDNEHHLEFHFFPLYLCCNMKHCLGNQTEEAILMLPGWVILIRRVSLPNQALTKVSSIITQPALTKSHEEPSSNTVQIMLFFHTQLTTIRLLL